MRILYISVNPFSGSLINIFIISWFDTHEKRKEEEPWNSFFFFWRRKMTCWWSEEMASRTNDKKRSCTFVTTAALCTNISSDHPCFSYFSDALYFDLKMSKNETNKRKKKKKERKLHFRHHRLSFRSHNSLAHDFFSFFRVNLTFFFHLHLSRLCETAYLYLVNTPRYFRL